MVILIVVLPGTLIVLVVTLLHPVTDVEVMVGVNKDVGVKVEVAISVPVGVNEGTSVGVLVGRVVNVITGPGENVEVAVGVLVGAGVDVLVGTVAVNVADGPDGADVLVAESPSRSYIPRMVRALDEVIGRELMGIKLIIGL